MTFRALYALGLLALLSACGADGAPNPPSVNLHGEAEVGVVTGG